MAPPIQRRTIHGPFTPEVDLTAGEQDAAEQRNQDRLRQLKLAVEHGYRPTQQEAQFIAGYYKYDPRANTISDYSWWHTYGPIVMATAGMAAGGIVGGTGALAGLGGTTPGLVPGLIDTAAGGLPAAIGPVLGGLGALTHHDAYGTDGTDPPPEPYGPPEPDRPPPSAPSPSTTPPNTTIPPVMGPASHHLRDALTDTALNGIGGLLQGLGDGLFQQHRESYSGTDADPVKLLSAIGPQLDAMKGRITSRAPVDLGPGPGPLPTFSGGGLPMPIGVSRRTDATSFQPHAGLYEHAQVLAALAILKGRA